MDLAGPPAEAPSKSLPPPTQGQGGAGGSGSDDSDDEEPVADFDGRWGGWDAVCSMSQDHLTLQTSSRPLLFKMIR